MGTGSEVPKAEPDWVRQEVQWQKIRGGRGLVWEKGRGWVMVAQGQVSLRGLTLAGMVFRLLGGSVFVDLLVCVVEVGS